MNMNMNKLKKQHIIILAIVVAIAVLSTNIYSSNYSKADEDKNKKYAISRDTDITLDSTGDLKISRTKVKNTPMSTEDSWSMFIYMTGSDLESGYESASKDIKEMLAASGYNEKVNIIIQTGGSGKWHTDGVDATSIGRYKIVNGKFEKIETIELASMGRADTLYNFLEWGVKNYPAKHMGAMFWNHGSGISSGVCIDTIYNEDSLGLGEVEYAFAMLNDEVLTDQFELIGFDTCLSGSLEYASALAPYARYMVASADVEPNEGWFYTDFIKYIYDNPSATGDKVGQVIVDSYGKFFETTNRKDGITLATYDLSQVDKVCFEMNKFAKYLNDSYKAQNDASILLELIGSPRTYDMGCMDLGSLVGELKENGNYDASSLEAAIDKLVMHNKIGSSHQKRECNGITIYAPFTTISMNDLNVCRNALISPYWLNVLEVSMYFAMKTEAGVYGKSLSYTVDDWTNSELYYEDTFEYVQYESLSNRDDETYKLLKKNSKYEFASKWNKLFNEYKEAIKVPSNPFSGGNFGSGFGGGFGGGLEISREKISGYIEDTTNVADVYSALYKTEDNNVIFLGEQANVNYDKDAGSITADTINQWFALPDGQLLTTLVVEKISDYTVYGFPVVINGVESTIRIKETVDTLGKKDYELLGVWDAVETSSYAPRGYLPLSIGTNITPIYDVYNTETNEYETEYGEEYTIASEFDFVYVDIDMTSEDSSEEYYSGVVLDTLVGNDIVIN